jgi:hypothetical protein
MKKKTGSVRKNIHARLLGVIAQHVAMRGANEFLSDESTAHPVTKGILVTRC